MLYGYIVKNEIRKTFDHVNNHRWDEAVKAVAPHVHHRVSGAHALGGERHDKKAMRRWFERLGRVQPTLHLTVNNIWVKGWPWHTTVFAQWDGTATLLNGDSSYFNHGLHVFTLRWGRVLCTRGISRFTSSSPCSCCPSGSWPQRSCRRTNCKLAEAQSEAAFFR